MNREKLIQVNCRVLSNGVEIPLMGYGTDMAQSWRCMDNSIKKLKKRIRQYYTLIKQKNKRKLKIDLSLLKIIKMAPKYNCFLYDTSRAYGGSERVLGKGLRKYNRKKFFIITKLSNYDQRNKTVREALKDSLKQLDMDYVDLYLIHWPQTNTYLDSWKQMEELYKEGFCRAIGVCNCNIHHLEEIKKIAEIMPMVNQFECHPLFVNDNLRNYCNQNGIQVMAYTPTGRMDFRLSNNRKLETLSTKYNKSIPQIILRWHIQMGNIPIVNTIKQKHLKDNMDIFDFELSEDDVKLVTSININSRLRYDPDNCDFERL